ncbi:MAG TPA: VWA domain-containing protein [Vicinamibacterales bacterium]|nr:VWA domain-containing protein [Vicinamibacterales bacterium]
MTTKDAERKTNRTCAAALWLCVVPVLLVAQDQPTFRTGTTLVEFTVVALDSKGNPVTDLTSADLTLTDRGLPREIAFFRFDGGPPAVEATLPPPLTPGFVTNRPEYQPAPQRNVTAVVLDMINTAPPDQNGARAQLLRHLNALPANTPVGLFRFTEREQMQVLAPFTRRLELMRSELSAVVATSRQELVRPGHGGGQIVGGDCGPADAGGVVPGASATSRGSGRGSSTMAEGMSIFEEVQSRQLSAINQTIRSSRLDKTLTNLEALGNHLAAIPGRKHVVWISSGMPIQLRAVQVNGNTVQGIMNFEPRIRQAAQRLANQGIVIYPVDAKGGCRALDNSTTQGRYGLNDPPQEVFSSLNVIADVTGGRVIKHENDLSKGIIAASNDLRGTYTVGFYAADEPDDRWHAIEVSTRRKGISLRHRQGYLSVARTQPQSLDADAWSQLARASLASSGIRLNGRPTLGPQQVTVLLQIAAGDLYLHDRGGKTIADLEIAVVEKAAERATNVRAQPLEVTINDPAKDHRDAIIPAATTWPLNPETTALRVIVRDRLTGRYGTLEMQLVAGSR